MRTFRAALHILYSWGNKEIFKEVNIPSVMETTAKLDSNLYSSVVSHPNPSTLASFE